MTPERKLCLLAHSSDFLLCLVPQIEGKELGDLLPELCPQFCWGLYVRPSFVTLIFCYSVRLCVIPSQR